MGAIASQNTSLTIVYSMVYSGTDQRKHQSSASLAFVRGIHRWPHKWPVTRKKFPFDYVIILTWPRNLHYSNVIMSAMASDINGVLVVCSMVYSGADQRKHQSSASQALGRGIHRWPVDSPHKRPVTQKYFHLMTSSCKCDRRTDRYVDRKTNTNTSSFGGSRCNWKIAWYHWKSKPKYT